MDATRIEAITQTLERRRRDLGRSVAVGIDGGTGTGKTTIAFQLAGMVAKGFVLQTDSYHVPLACAYRMEPRIGDAGAMIDWSRLRETALLPLRENKSFRVNWINPFTRQLEASHEVAPNTIVICEGTFCLRPELWDLYEHRILVTAESSVATTSRLLRDQTLGDEWRRYVNRVWLPDEDRHLASLSIKDVDDIFHRIGYEPTGE